MIIDSCTSMLLRIDYFDVDFFVCFSNNRLECNHSKNWHNEQVNPAAEIMDNAKSVSFTVHITYRCLGSSVLVYRAGCAWSLNVQPEAESNTRPRFSTREVRPKRFPRYKAPWRGGSGRRERKTNSDESGERRTFTVKRASSFWVPFAFPGISSDVSKIRFRTG